MKFSKRTSWPGGSNPLSGLLEAKRSRGEEVLDLTQSNPTCSDFKYLDPGLLSDLQDPANLKYEPDPRGILEARKAVAEYYLRQGIAVDPERIFLLSSTSEAYAFLFRLLADPGDRILSPKPSYPLFDFLSDLSDTRLEKYGLVYREGRWEIDFSSLRNLLADAPKAVLCVHPNNPTGHFISPEEKKVFFSGIDPQKTAVIADEVFFDFSFSPALKKESFASENPALTFTLSGISKILGLPQMKLSWIVISGPEDLCAEAAKKLEIIADTYLSVNTPVQRALAAWLGKGGAMTREILDRVQANHLFLNKAVSGFPSASVLASEGGWHAVLKLDSGRTDEEIALDLLRDHGVLTHPGYLFDFEDGAYLVLSLLPAPEIFERGVAKLLDGLRKSPVL